MSIKLFIGNLAVETTHAQLRDLFSTAGLVKSCRVIIDRTTGASKGFPDIEVTSVADANAVVKKFNGTDYQGKRMNVNEARQWVS